MKNPPHQGSHQTLLKATSFPQSQDKDVNENTKRTSRIMQNNKYRGFTLTELLATVSILGILTSISLPMFNNQVAKTRQGEAEAILIQLQISTMAYIDEFMIPPTHWGDLSRISTVLTESGPIEASTGDQNKGNLLTGEITIPGGKYKIKATTVATETEKNFVFEAFSQQESHKSGNLFNVIGCIDTENGATDSIKGNNIAADEKSLTCS